MHVFPPRIHQFRAGRLSAPDFRPDRADPLSRLALAEADQLDAESWAELVAWCLGSGPSAIDLTSDDLLTFMQT
jgi:hypothetical protein